MKKGYPCDTNVKMAFIKEESEDVKIEEKFRVKYEDTEEQTKMAFIKEESEDVKIEEKFRVKKEDTETQMALVVLKEESQALNEVEQNDQDEKHDFKTGEKFIQTKKTSSRKRANRYLTCPQCGNSFNHICKLKAHMRFHSREKPFTCSQCGKRFRQEIFLQSHMRIHTGEKPFKCYQCDRRFMYKKDLKRHWKTDCGIGLPLVLEIIESL